MAMFQALAVLSFQFLILHLTSGETYLRADGVTETYDLIDGVFGESAHEVPDCNHTSFGSHITQVHDTVLNRPVFAFHSHIHLDYDAWCTRFDRQRTEIKPRETDESLVGFSGDRLTLSWNFKLDAEFKAPYGFCHIHQLKAQGGDDSMPIITLTPRRSSPNELQLLQYDSKGDFFFLASEPLERFLGIWIHGTSEITVGPNGKYHFQLSRLSDGQILLDYVSNSIDFWRNETSFIFPKWGIYRSVHERVLNRDEIVLFDEFCIGKDGNGDCV